MWVSPLISGTKNRGMHPPLHTPQPQSTQQKTDLHLQVGFMELMTGFEPVTSSLPMQCKKKNM